MPQPNSIFVKILPASLIVLKPICLKAHWTIGNLDNARWAKSGQPPFLAGSLWLFMLRWRVNVLAVLHDPNLAFLSGDHFIFLKDGRVRETTGEERPWGAGLLSEVYGTPIETIPFRDRVLVVPF